MRLTLKLVAAFVIGNVALATVYGYLAVRREVLVFEQTATDEAESVGTAMQDALADAWRRNGHQGVLGLLHNANGEEHSLRIRWVWFDSQPGTPFSPSVPAAQLTTITVERHVGVYAFSPQGEPCLHVYWPVALNADRKGGLEFSRPTGKLDENQREIVVRTAYLIGGMVLLSGLLATLLGVRFVGTPLRRLVEKTNRVAAGDLQGPVLIRSHDELSQLGESLNRMCEEALERGDQETYRLLNKEANDVHGRVFFSRFGLSAAALWPVFFALEGVQRVHLESAIPIPFTPWSANYVVVFILCYIAARLLFGRIKRRLPYFKTQYAMLQEYDKSDSAR